MNSKKMGKNCEINRHYLKDSQSQRIGIFFSAKSKKIPEFFKGSLIRVEIFSKFSVKSKFFRVFFIHRECKLCVVNFNKIVTK